jgi:hypothetical protein
MTLLLELFNHAFVHHPFYTLLPFKERIVPEQKVPLKSIHIIMGVTIKKKCSPRSVLVNFNLFPGSVLFRAVEPVISS